MSCPVAVSGAARGGFDCGRSTIGDIELDNNTLLVLPQPDAQHLALHMLADAAQQVGGRNPSELFTRSVPL